MISKSSEPYLQYGDAEGNYSDVEEQKLVPQIHYKYSEDKILDELKDYIDSTYTQHYASEIDGKNVQLNDIFIADGTAMPFFRNNSIKYLSRFGRKDGTNRKDLLKTLHYTMLMLYLDDLER